MLGQQLPGSSFPTTQSSAAGEEEEPLEAGGYKQYPGGCSSNSRSSSTGKMHVLAGARARTGAVPLVGVGQVQTALDRGGCVPASCRALQGRLQAGYNQLMDLILPIPNIEQHSSLMGDYTEIQSM